MQGQVQNLNKKLFQSLLALGKTAIDKVIKYRDGEKLEVIPYQYLPVASVDYLMGTYQYDWNKLEYFDYYEWSTESFIYFIENELQTLPEFEVAAQEVIKEFGAPEWTDTQTGEVKESYSIITTAANPMMEIIHNSKKRMPLIIDEEDQFAWLEAKDEKTIKELMVPFPAEKMKAYPIHKKFSDPRVFADARAALLPQEYAEVDLKEFI